MLSVAQQHMAAEAQQVIDPRPAVRYVYGVARRLSRRFAHDIAQEALRKLWRAGRLGANRAYLARATCNTACDMAAHERRGPALFDDILDSEQVANLKAPSPDAQDPRLDDLRRAVRRLTPAQQRALAEPTERNKSMRHAARERLRLLLTMLAVVPVVSVRCHADEPSIDQTLVWTNGYELPATEPTMTAATTHVQANGYVNVVAWSFVPTVPVEVDEFGVPWARAHVTMDATPAVDVLVDVPDYAQTAWLYLGYDVLAPDATLSIDMAGAAVVTLDDGALWAQLWRDFVVAPGPIEEVFPEPASLGLLVIGGLLLGGRRCSTTR